ncbi:TonB-dependent receptor [Henriciella sp.]|uniref:TonB-dependent receptor n=1 Tax=Henriciella sp. TaxID=1968823 RepID=UPI002623101F|nr:TonB-dependent receptor [Henriciella sp.]
MTRKYLLTTGSALVAMMNIAAANAQSTEPPAEDEALVQSAIMVTAQKREQRLIDVPMAIESISGDNLSKLGVDNIQDLSFNVPGLTMREDGPGSYTIFIRGLANQSGSGALVGMYLDEAPLSLSGYNQLSPVPLDLERVEVLKGPQGTLYGQGAAGGVIRFITADPVLDRVEGKVKGEVYTVSEGETGQKGELVFNTPLIEDKLAVRFALGLENGGGWIDQPEAGIEDGNGTELVNARGKILWEPTSNFSAKAMVQIHRAETELGMGYEEPDRTVDVGPDRSKVMIPKKFDFDIYNLELNYDFGFAELTSSTTQIEHDHQYPFTYIPREGNYSFGIVEGNNDRFIDAEQFSQELRLSDAGDRFAWTLGAFYSTGERSFTEDYEYAYAANGDLYQGGGILIDDLYYFSGSTSDSYSLFADGSYDVTDRLTLGAGLRYFHDEQTSLIEDAPGTGTEQSATFESVDPRVYLTYKYAQAATIYASAGSGFRSGGFNREPVEPYDPENILTYELGTKGNTSNFQYDVAVFFTEYKDMVRRRLTEVNGALLGESSNIGKVEVKGVEAGLAYQPVSGLTLSANAAYLDSEIVETADTDQVNNVGDPTDYTPELSYTLGINYDFDWAPNYPGFARVGFNHRDEVTYIDRSSFLPSALPQSSDALNLLNARAGVQVGNVDLEVYATNITDENKSIDPYQGWANANRTQPRVIGVSAAYSF